MKRLKSYSLMVTLSYKIFSFIILPILVIGIRILQAVALKGASAEAMMAFTYISGGLYIVLQVIADFFVFGGSFAKGKERFDIFKNSNNGLKVLRSVYHTDIAIKALYSLVFMGFLQIGTGLSIGNCMLLALVSFATILLASIVDRFITVWTFVIFSVYLATAVYVAGVVGIVAASPIIKFIIIIAALSLAIIGIVFDCLMLEHKIKESYHD